MVEEGVFLLTTYLRTKIIKNPNDIKEMLKKINTSLLPSNNAKKFLNNLGFEELRI